MKPLLILTLILFPKYSFADPLNDYLEKMKSVVAKDGRCDFGVVQVPTGKHATNKSLWPTTVACIGNITLNGGTMKERSGCGAFHLDTDDLTTKGVGSEGRMKIANGKKCSDGGFEEVMGLNLYGYVDEPAGFDNKGKPNMSVGWIFYDGSRSDFMEPKILLQNSGGEKYQQWWTKNHRAAIAKTETTKSEAKKAQAADAIKEKASQEKAKAAQKQKEDLWN